MKKTIEVYLGKKCMVFVSETPIDLSDNLQLMCLTKKYRELTAEGRLTIEFNSAGISRYIYIYSIVYLIIYCKIH